MGVVVEPGSSFVTSNRPSQNTTGVWLRMQHLDRPIAVAGRFNLYAQAGSVEGVDLDRPIAEIEEHMTMLQLTFLKMISRRSHRCTRGGKQTKQRGTAGENRQGTNERGKRKETCHHGTPRESWPRRCGVGIGRCDGDRRQGTRDVIPYVRGQ